MAVSTASLVQVHNDDILKWEVLDDDNSTVAINSVSDRPHQLLVWRGHTLI